MSGSPGNQEGKQVRFEGGTGSGADVACPPTTNTFDTPNTMGTMGTMDTANATNAATPCPSAGGSCLGWGEDGLGSPAERVDEQMPSDEEIQASLKNLIAGSDLATVTPRLLRKSLESRFGVSMKTKKGIIRETIEAVVQVKGEEALESEAAPGADTLDEEAAELAAAGSGKTKRYNRFGDILSYQMAEFLGMERCSRLIVVKKLWAYIKENKLQDPKDGRKIIFDERLMAVFGENGRRKGMTMFSMNKLLTKHVRVDDGRHDDMVAGPAKKAKKTTAAASAVRASDTKPASDTKKNAKAAAVPASNAKSASDEKSGNSKKGMMTKELELSEDLQKLVGAPRTTRAQVVKRFWQYIKERDLLDPKDKRFVLTDELLERMTGKKRFKAFGFQKLFSRHMWEEGEVL